MRWPPICLVGGERDFPTRSPMQSKTALALLAAVACPLAFGCSSSVNGDGKPVVSSSAALRRTQSCEDLTQALRDDARSKLNRRIDAQVRAIREGYTSYYGPNRGGGLEFAPAGPSATNGAAVDDAAGPSPQPDSPSTASPTH